MKIIIFGLIAVIIGFSSCNFSNNDKSIVIETENVSQITLNDSTRNSLIRRGHAIARQTQRALKKELGKAIKSGGMANAIGFCNLRAIKISDSISQAEQIMVKRVAIKNRNPNNAMTEQESKLFSDATALWDSNKITKPGISVNKDHQAVYSQSIIMTSVCLNCHGSLESDIKPEVALRIKELYPNDKAVNFKAKDLRGMWVITFPEYYIK